MIHRKCNPHGPIKQLLSADICEANLYRPPGTSANALLHLYDLAAGVTCDMCC